MTMDTPATTPETCTDPVQATWDLDENAINALLDILFPEGT